jgi:hypothetical protein
MTLVPSACWLAPPAPEGEARHQDGAKAQGTGLHRRLDQGFSLGAEILCEFDDQDGVLGGKANDGDEADGEIDVVR